ncbi:MAG: DUF58 domain-containing protein [Geobacteraceae bacterium]|nr:DUF58 domain-containing protein [Geobacteraceae bacterium]
MSITGLAGMYNLKGLRPELLAAVEIFAGSATPFRLRLHNDKQHLPSFLIRIECENGQGATLPVVPPASVTETSVQMTFARRGHARVGTVKISSSFPVDFFTRFWSFSLDDEFIVYPRLLPGVAVGSGPESRLSGTVARRELGQDGELERISDYSGREPLRVIHWKLSARGDDLLVKEFGRQSVSPLVIDPEKLAGNSVEERISQAAWLVRRWVQQRPVGLTCGGRTIPPASGRVQRTRLLKELALYGLD